jgi:hypothetical protein
MCPVIKDAQSTILTGCIRRSQADKFLKFILNQEYLKTSEEKTSGSCSISDFIQYIEAVLQLRFLFEFELDYKDCYDECLMLEQKSQNYLRNRGTHYLFESLIINLDEDSINKITHFREFITRKFSQLDFVSMKLLEIIRFRRYLKHYSPEVSTNEESKYYYLKYLKFLKKQIGKMVLDILTNIYVDNQIYFMSLNTNVYYFQQITMPSTLDFTEYIEEKTLRSNKHEKKIKPKSKYFYKSFEQFHKHIHRKFSIDSKDSENSMNLINLSDFYSHYLSRKNKKTIRRTKKKYQKPSYHSSNSKIGRKIIREQIVD